MIRKICEDGSDESGPDTSEQELKRLLAAEVKWDLSLAYADAVTEYFAKYDEVVRDRHLRRTLKRLPNYRKQAAMALA